MTKDVVACGALALHIDQIAKRRGWDIEARPLPPELHNRPERIRDALEASDDVDLVGYADCGTRGALDDLPRLAGPDCYGIFGEFEGHEPGRTTSPTSSSAPSTGSSGAGSGSTATRSSATTTSATTSASSGSPRRRRRELQRKAEAAAALGLPLEIRPTGDSGSERALERLLHRRLPC